MAQHMNEPTPTEGGAVASGSSTTLISETSSTEETPPPPTVRLVLKKPKNDKRVNWTNDTVDNEHMNKRKSKCCCIYKKPHVFGESSSESEDECENCFGHCEFKKQNPPNPPPSVPPVS